MTTYQEALSRILKEVRALEVEQVPLLCAVGQVTAEDIYSDYDLPMLDTAGPDGYAVRSEDITGAHPDDPVTLRIIGTARAGRIPRRRVSPGTAMRIMTGSPVPKGADCVVPFESTDELGDKNGPSLNSPSKVKVFQAVEPGRNIRPAGSSLRKGSLVLPKGRSVGPAQISVLGTIGRTMVQVTRRPRVAIISTGDELLHPGSPLRPGRSYDANAAAVASLVTHYGGVPRVLGIARDNEASLTAKMRRASTFDAIITSGGVSKGDYDLVRLVVGSMGRVVFSRIDMGPGASFALGLVDRTTSTSATASIPVFALSGPPAGCLINFETLVRPALRKMMGFTALDHPIVDAVVEDSSDGSKPMTFVKWSRLDSATARLRAVPGRCRVALDLSERLGPLSALSMANCLTIVPRDTEVRSGDWLEVLPLDWTRD